MEIIYSVKAYENVLLFMVTIYERLVFKGMKLHNQALSLRSHPPTLLFRLVSNIRTTVMTATYLLVEQDKDHVKFVVG